jgi:uncharacterized protein DUF6064
MLPFTRDQFLAVFVSYNGSIWPAQAVAYLLALSALGMLVRPGPITDRLLGAILALFWTWTGVAYHGLFFSRINKAAYVFAALFVAQGVYFGVAGVLQGRLSFGFRRSSRQGVGLVFVLYATLAYPMIGRLAGHSYDELPMFGVTPCPVTIFSFGVLLLAVKPLPRLALVIPLLWSLIGGSAAVLLGIPQDWLLLVSGLMSSWLIVLSERRERLVSPS